MINDNFIINEFSDHRGKINPNKLRINWLNKHVDIKNYLEHRYPNDDFVSYLFVVKRIFNHIEELPVCQNCGKKLYNINGKWCNTTCQLTDPKFIKWRNENIDLESQIQKWKENFYKKSENERKQIFNKGIQTKIEKYGDNFGKVINEKIKQTCLERYGEDNVFKVDKIKEKSKQTKLEKYNDSNFNNRIKCAETCQHKYGTSNFMLTNEFKEKSKQTKLERYGNAYFTNIEKAKQTCLKKYGVDNWGKTQESINITHTKEVNLKRELTKKKNGTLNSSKIEDKSYELLKEKYPDVIRQYRSEFYPFNCDFYIPNLDLYIECQYGQFHHGRPYLGTEQDLSDIEILKENAKRIHQEKNVSISRYDVEIETWSIRDVKKRNIAKENKLNYIEFWNIKELQEWLNNKNTI